MSEAAGTLKLSRRRRWLFRGLAVFISLAVCFGLLEAGLRLFGPEYHRLGKGSYEYPSNPRGYFDVLREEDGRKVYWIRINLREARPQVRLPDNAVDDLALAVSYANRRCSILGLGDSFTFGQGVRFKDIYLSRLEKLLAESERPTPIRNCGVRGFDLGDMRSMYSYACKIRGQPFPLVIYGMVLNDFGLPGLDSATGVDFIDEYDESERDSVWRERLATVNFVASTLKRWRLDRVSRKAYLAAFEGDNARKGFGLLKALHGAVERGGGKFAIVLFPLLYEFNDYPFQEIHDKIAAFCKKEGIPLLDLLPAFAKHDAEKLWVHPIDHHPNEKAHKIAAEKLFEFLNRQGLLDLLPPASQPAAGVD